MQKKFPEILQQFAADFDARFAAFLVSPPQPPGMLGSTSEGTGHSLSTRLVEAVRYAALAPGKRVRPYLVVRVCELCGGRRDDAWAAAAAVECVHAFSLVHDDLPAMDNDDLRRGRPTTHRQFDEATAILAGDALVVLAFELLARNYAETRRVGNESAGTAGLDRALPAGTAGLIRALPGGLAAMVLELAEAAGWSGMIGGQAADLAGESLLPGLELTRAIHFSKTARLIAAACRIGALAANADREAVATVSQFGLRLGEAFQITDDLLDVIASSDQVGKGVGKDAPAGKQTFPRAIGIEASRLAAKEAASAAFAHLTHFGPDADDLRTLTSYVFERDY